MKKRGALLLALDGSAAAAAALGCAHWLAGRLDAQLHILSAGQPPLQVHEALQRLQVDPGYWPSIALHQASAPAEDAVLAVARELQAEFIVMSAVGQDSEEEGGPFQLLGHVTRHAVEHGPVPVLVMPPRYRERLPWTRVLVPVSGEVEADSALSVAVSLATALEIQVEVAHVIGAGGEARGLAAEARYPDALHHEYGGRLQGLVSRALAGCSSTSCLSVREIRVLRGEPAEELLGLIGQEESSVLVVGWHGDFVAGHARVLKHMLREISCPVLLVRAAPRAQFRLDIAEDLE